MHFEQVLGLLLSLYLCVHGEPRHHSYHQNAYWWKGRHRHYFESECDPGWQCVAMRDCHGVIKPWYAPKSRCGSDHTLVCCGPKTRPEVAAHGTELHRPEPPHYLVDHSDGNGIISPSEQESECDPGWRCLAMRDCHGAIKPWYAPKSRCGRDHMLVCCGPTPVPEVVVSVYKFRRPDPAKSLRKSEVNTTVEQEARQRRERENECDPGWRCVAQRDCRGAIKPGYSPKSRCGSNRSLICCGPTRSLEASNPGTAVSEASLNSQQNKTTVSGAMSPSERGII